MLESLLMIIGAYGSCVLAVHAAHLWNRKDPKSRPRHLVLIVRNQQHRVEWVLRSLLFISWLKGKNVRLTVVDCGSADGTADIVKRLAQRASFAWHSLRSEAEMEPWLARNLDGNAVIVHLGQHEDVNGLLAFC